MTKSLDASPLLAELRGLFNAQDAVALLPTPMLDMSVGTMSVDPMGVAAIVDMQQRISALLAEATDAELIEAYLNIGDESGELAAEALIAELEQRDIKIG